MTRIKYQSILSHRSYTIKELATLLKISEKTCLRWIEGGMKTVEGSKKPILILGSEAKEFIRTKNEKRKVPLGRCEFYCFTCKCATSAKRGSIEKVGTLKKALCRVCNGKVSRTFKPYQKDYHIPVDPIQMSFFGGNTNNSQNDKRTL